MAKASLHDLEYTFESNYLENGNVDAINGIVRDVSVITSGVTARGHNLQVDMKCLEQMNELAQKMGKVPVKTNHRTGVDAVNGYLTNFAIKDGKLKADWHLLKSHKEFNHLLEMSEVMAGSFGLSAAFMGRSVDSKGREIFDEEVSPGKSVKYVNEGGKKIQLSTAEKQFARCSELISVDVVATAAANPDGLFESKVDIQEKKNMATETKTTEQKLEELMTAFAASQEQVNSLSATLTQLVEFATSEDDEDEEEDEDEDEEDEDEKPSKKKGADNEYSTVADAITYLEEKVARQIASEEDAKLSHAFSVIEEKVIALTELNAALVAENQALFLSVKEGNGQAALPGRESANRLFNAGSNQDEWEARVTELEAEGKSKTDAIRFAIAEDSKNGFYTKHQARVGLIRL